MPENRVRLDKWLWAARFYKTRGLARDAIEAGRVKVEGNRVKPSREVRVGDTLTVRAGYDDWQITVAGLSDRRGPAEIARTLYSESEQSRAARLKAQQARKYGAVVAVQGEGRPTKRDRRQLERLRGDD